MRFAVKVRYAQERTIMVDASSAQEASRKAEAVAMGFTNVVDAKAVSAKEMTVQQAAARMAKRREGA